MNRGSVAVELEQVALRYDQHDYFRFVALPPLGPGATSPAVVAPVELLDSAFDAHGIAEWFPENSARLELIGGGEVLQSVEGVAGASLSFLEAGREARANDTSLALRLVNLGDREIKPTVAPEVSPVGPPPSE